MNKQVNVKAKITPGLFPSERIVTVRPANKRADDVQAFVAESQVDEVASTVTAWLLDQDEVQSLVRFGNNTVVVVSNDSIIE